MKTFTLVSIFLLAFFEFTLGQTDECRQAYDQAITKCQATYYKALADENASKEKQRSKDSSLAKSDLDACIADALAVYNDCRCGTYPEIPPAPAYILGSNKICPSVEWSFSVPEQESACWLEWKVTPSDNVSINEPEKNKVTIVFPLGFAGGTLEVTACNTLGCSKAKTLSLSLRSDCAINTQGLTPTNEFVPGVITRVYPNQDGDNVIVDYNSSASGTVILNIYNSHGSLITHERDGVAEGKNSIRVAVNNLEQGEYTVEIIAIDSRSQFRFNVMRH